MAPMWYNNFWEEFLF